MEVFDFPYSNIKHTCEMPLSRDTHPPILNQISSLKSIRINGSKDITFTRHNAITFRSTYILKSRQQPS